MKIKYYWKGEYQGKHKVKVKDRDEHGCHKIVVKDFSEDLYPEYRGRVVCKLTETPNLVHKIELEDGIALKLDVCQAQALMSALMASEILNSTSWKIKE